MKRKLLENKIRPLICKKRSKSSKKKNIVCEYEKNISTLLKNMTISDVTNGNNLSSGKCVPFNICRLESSMRNKFLRCNLRTYSSYTSSKSLNIYKKSESKCIRFISIGSYLQGKVSCTPNFATSEVKRLAPVSTNRNKYVALSEPKSLFGTRNKFKLETNKDILMRGKFGEIPNLEVKCIPVSMMSKRYEVFKYCKHEGLLTLDVQRNDIIDIDIFKTKQFDNLKRFIFLDHSKLQITMSIYEESLFANYKNICHMLPITSRKKFRTLPAVNGYSSGTVTNCQPLNALPKENNTFLITNSHETLTKRLEIVKKTITEILEIHLRIESYQTIFMLYNYESSTLKDIDKMKLRSVRLLMKCNLVLNKVYQPKYFYKELKAHREQNKIHSYGTTLSDNSRLDKIYGITKRNCKRKKKAKAAQTLKRSKLLDDCIQRACASKRLPQRSKFMSVMNSEKEKTTNYKNGEMNYSDERAKLTDVLANNSDPVERNLTNVPVLANPVDNEFSRILLNLPSEETLEMSESLVKNHIDLSNLTDLIHYDIGNGRKMVILPYVDI